ncbi:LacI family DNA-binding transcriptional regulator [Saccharobesus litoralis]|uniref:LacI family DNA-binding transcriptional regulator n=1 Tax=Saccharobesus litoralis TaxID=2172099 RepID=UPI00131F1068|nr:LacI family DNA-binding transcriptional regulator [Saccharobesus litoralis]
MKITLKDIAAEAGVSRATVDRVLNGRGKVSQYTIDRVNQAVEKFNNRLTPTSASHVTTSYNFDFIFPTRHSRLLDFYSRQINAIHQICGLNDVNVRIHRVEAFQPQLLADKLLEVAQDSHGIAFVALEHPLVRDAVDTVINQNVNVITLVNDISGTDRHAYIGIDNRAAGRTAAHIMGRFLGKNAQGKIGLFIGSHAYLGHEERESGFRSLLRAQYPNLQIIEMPEVLDNDDNAQQIFIESLKGTKDLLGIYNIGGGTEGIAQALKSLNMEHECVFIAHELFEHTRAHLVTGTIDAIINQDLALEADNAIKILRSRIENNSIINLPKPKVEVYFPENIT